MNTFLQTIVAPIFSLPNTHLLILSRLCSFAIFAGWGIALVTIYLSLLRTTKTESCNIRIKPSSSYRNIWPALVAYIAGIFIAASGTTIAILAITACIGAFYILQRNTLQLRKNAKNLSLITMFLALGGLMLLAHNAQHTLLEHVCTRDPVNLKAYVSSITPGSSPSDRSKILLRLHSMKPKNSDAYYSIEADILCFVHKTGNLKEGSFIEVNNLELGASVSKQSAAKNNSFRAYLRRENIIGTYFGYKLCSKPLTQGFGLSALAGSFRSTLQESLCKKLSKQTAYLFNYIFLGNKSERLSSEDQATFGYWGITHYLARSGLHVVLFILFWQFILSILPLHLHIKKILLAALCCLYALCSWPSVSFYRALLVFYLFEAGKLCGRQVIFLHLLCLMCLLMLLYNPTLVLFLDFQLSFGLAFTLSFFHYYLKRHNPHRPSFTLKAKEHTL